MTSTTERHHAPREIPLLFSTTRTMTVRLVVDIQNRLFWRIGIGRILSAVLSLRDGAEVHEMGIDVPAEQRLQGFEPLVAADRVVLIAAPSPSQQKDRCLVQTSTGSADGFTASRSYPRPIPLTSTYAVRGSVPRRGRPLCARGHRAWSTDAGGKPTDGTPAGCPGCRGRR